MDHNWYRNREWDTQIESMFRKKLSRARSQRLEYVYVQALTLLERHPDVSMRLVDEFLTDPDSSRYSASLSCKANALARTGETSLAVEFYKAALEHEKTCKGSSNARLEYPKLVAEFCVKDEYDNAMLVLSERFTPDDHIFPKVRYEWNGSAAIICNARGELEDAKDFALRALRAREQKQSPFVGNPNVGLVDAVEDGFFHNIQRIANQTKPEGPIFKFLNGIRKLLS